MRCIKAVFGLTRRGIRMIEAPRFSYSNKEFKAMRRRQLPRARLERWDGTTIE
jgi:hypothetical protein